MVSHPVQDNQHCLQTLSNVPGNSQLSQVENNSSLWWSCVSQAGLGLCVIQAGLKFIAILLPLLLEHRVYKSEPQHPAFVLGQVPEVRTWLSPAHGLWQNLHGKERAWMSMNWRFTPLFWWGKKNRISGRIQERQNREGEGEEWGEGRARRGGGCSQIPVTSTVPMQDWRLGSRCEKDSQTQWGASDDFTSVWTRKLTLFLHLCSLEGPGVSLCAWIDACAHVCEYNYQSLINLQTESSVRCKSLKQTSLFIF